MKSRLTSIALILAATVSLTAQAQEITDLDNDGTLSVEEVQAARDEARDAARAERVAEFDTDDDGVLSDEERNTAREARAADRMAVSDTDEDGETSRAERQAAREERQEAFSANFDLDNSGDLSETEQANLEAVTTEIRGNRGGNRNRRNR